MDALDTVFQLTERELPLASRRQLLKRFADASGWLPSDEIDSYPETDDIANGHLLVEHGLSNTAVITFLKPQVRYRSLSTERKIRLLEISYNNLVQWHLFPDTVGVTVVFNLKDPPHDFYVERTDKFDAWRAQSFDQVVGRKPTPNVRALDDALIATVKHWKFSLAADLKGTITNENISALLNSVLLLRAMEDCIGGQEGRRSRTLIDLAVSLDDGSEFVLRLFDRAFAILRPGGRPEIFDDQRSKLAPFSQLGKSTVVQLCRDFYRHSSASPYQYDFSLITKHALSRIYESYVSILREKDTPQLTLFTEFEEEEINKDLGGVYTPQFIARFFARFLKENLTPPAFRALKSIDPACGSGIFLRTTLEMQCDPFQDVDVATVTDKAFQNAYGMDIDPNACEATRLSLQLLHLVLTGKFRDNLNVVSDEAIKHRTEHPELVASFDAVIANPPFVKWNRLTTEMRDRVKSFMRESGSGKPDLFVAMLKLGMDLIKPGGFLLYVLPYSFLIAENGLSVRNELAESYWIRALVDLSDIPVFESVGSYVVLLIVQKKIIGVTGGPDATIVRCRGSVGEALQIAIEGRRASTSAFDVFQVGQSFFASPRWSILPPAQTALSTRLQTLKKIDELAVVKQGFVTGLDKVFVRPRSEVPRGESDVWQPYLTDREMRTYSVPRKVQSCVFSPFQGNRKLTESELQTSYAETWSYLKQHARALKNRPAVAAGTLAWWNPERPRNPEIMRRAKIVTPHLILLPRFSLDEEGKYAVSHGPLIVPRAEDEGVDILLYLLAVLNSPLGYWQLSHLSDKYSRGYAMLEPKTLREVRVPDPSRVPLEIMQKIQFHIRSLISGEPTATSEKEVHRAVSELYRLTDRELAGLGIGVTDATDKG